MLYLALVLIVAVLGAVYYYKKIMRPPSTQPAPRRYSREEKDEAERNVRRDVARKIQDVELRLLAPHQKRIAELQTRLTDIGDLAQREFEEFSYRMALAGITDPATIRERFEISRGSFLESSRQGLVEAIKAARVDLEKAVKWRNVEVGEIIGDERAKYPELMSVPLLEESEEQKAARLLADEKGRVHLDAIRQQIREMQAFAKFQAALNAQGIINEDEIHARFAEHMRQQAEAQPPAAGEADKAG